MGYEFNIQSIKTGELEKGMRCPHCKATVLDPEKAVEDIPQCEHVLYHLVASEGILAYVHPQYSEWLETGEVPEQAELLDLVQSNVTLFVSEEPGIDVHIAIAERPKAFPT